MVFGIDRTGFDDRCVTGMTFWQLCTLKNMPQHNAPGSNTHTHAHTITNGGIFMQAVVFTSLAHFFGEHAATSLALFRRVSHTQLVTATCEEA